MSEVSTHHHDSGGETAQRIEFLYRAIEDAQATTRFVDTKAAFGIGLLSVMLAYVFDNLWTYFPWSAQSLLRQILIVAFSVLCLVCVWVVVRIIYPTTNPVENVVLDADVEPAFYLSELEPRRLRRFFFSDPRYSRLLPSQSAYIESIEAADGRVLLRVLAAELLKVSYVRQIKTDRLKGFTICLVAAAGMFLALLVADGARRESRLVEPAPPRFERVLGRNDRSQFVIWP